MFYCSFLGLFKGKGFLREWRISDGGNELVMDCKGGMSSLDIGVVRVVSGFLVFEFWGEKKINNNLNVWR